MQGWIKLHRKLMSSEIFRNEKLLKVFVYCLLKATHSEFEQKVGRQNIALMPGQFVFGRKKAALELEMKESTVRDYMNLLKDDNVITIKTTNKYSVITVVNWEFYQDTEEKADNKHATKTDSKRTTKGQQINTYKNEKNVKNEKKNKDDDVEVAPAPNPFDFYQQNFGTLSPFVMEDINTWIEDLNEALVIEAMKKALENKKQWNYAKAILKNWHSKSIHTLDDVQALQREFEQRKPSGKSKLKLITTGRPSHLPEPEVAEGTEEKIQRELEELPY